ncbi:hypothetical protein Tsubulata_007884 [Turnera subulata]|uniref:Uncharacterized protein n=1 Tax=Turnera subulata TaxID=218843 RepID=A0A9Q0J4D2_9ROSI|nr:hypothetical protein Tsubulata_007884 [Turnera subulata]
MAGIEPTSQAEAVVAGSAAHASTLQLYERAFICMAGIEPTSQAEAVVAGSAACNRGRTGKLEMAKWTDKAGALFLLIS